MKKFIFGLLILIITFPLFAQDIREARIFVPPVTGYGRAGDNAYFYRQLTSEVVLQYYGLVRSQRFCDYILRAEIVPFGHEEPKAVREVRSPVPDNPLPPLNNIPGTREYFSWEIDNNIYFYDTTGDDNYEPNVMPVYNPGTQEIKDDYEFILNIELINNLTNELLGEQQLVYAAVDASVGDLLSILVFNMLAGIPDIEETNDWHDKWIFLETSFLWAPRIYIEDNIETYNWTNFGLRAAFEFHFSGFMSFGAGAQIVQDKLVLDAVEYNDLILEFPIALKFVFKPANHFVLEPYAGISFNVSLLNTTIPSVSSWFAGLQFGIKAGQGMIVIDPRYSQDIETSEFPGKNNSYYRNSMQIGIGYKIGFFLKRSILDY